MEKQFYMKYLEKLLTLRKTYDPIKVTNTKGVTDSDKCLFVF